MIYKKSAVQLFEKHPCLYILAFGFVSAKITNKLVVSPTFSSDNVRSVLSCAMLTVDLFVSLTTGCTYDQK